MSRAVPSGAQPPKGFSGGFADIARNTQTFTGISGIVRTAVAQRIWAYGGVAVLAALNLDVQAGTNGLTMP